MKLSSKIHGILDYVTVVFLLSAPPLFDMMSVAATFTYALGIVHLVLTIFTRFELGIIKLVPLKIHGFIEILVAVALVAVAFFFRSAEDNIAFYFYLVFAIVLFIVWLLSDYKAQPVTSKKN